MPGSRLEEVYSELPVWLQNGIFSLYGLKLTRMRYSPPFFALLRALKEGEWWSVERICEHQNERIRSVVRHAYRTVPFYRRWYDEHGVDVDAVTTTDDLARLPILSKQTVREHACEMVSSAFAKRNLTKELTSGTTGTPWTIYQTREGAAFQWAIWWRHKARFGLNFGDRHLVFGARVPVSQRQIGSPYWRHDLFNKRVYLSTYHISPASVGAIVDYLNSTHFDFFTGYPSAMYALAALQAADLRLTNWPKYIVAGADALTPEFEASIRQVFGVPVTEQYGMAEFAGNMSRCEAGRFHLDFECCHLEQQPIPGGDNQYKLIFTGWGNSAMPFIRYEVGDVGSAAGTGAPAAARRSRSTASTASSRTSSSRRTDARSSA